MVPLFSIPTRSSWGIGEISDLEPLSRWVSSAGLDFVMLLPLNEMEEGQSSPYSALSAMAVDPIFIALRDVEDFSDAGGEQALGTEDGSVLRAVRDTAAIDYESVRTIKSHALGLAFSSFHSRHWVKDTPRAAELRRFIDSDGWWLDDYALFRALHEEDPRSWLEWSADLRDREPGALAAARHRLSDRILHYQYLQWLVDEQWQRVRRACAGVGIFGDFPFMVSSHSADVWSRQEEFRVDVSVGVPPDAFSETGQDWGLPAYRWDVVARTGYEWLRNRTRRSAELFDGFRIDHLVGFYRTYMKDGNGRTCFAPADEAAQRDQGERLLTLFSSCGRRILAEDLGTVPDFVRESMAHLGIPGFKVLRWEREWHQTGKPFRDPARYPAVSVATSSTHDTEALGEWWDNADEEERGLVLDIPLMRNRGITPRTAYGDTVRDALTETLMGAGSDLVIFPVQDLFGWRDRINRPASVNSKNWTWRLPFAAEELLANPRVEERARFLRRMSQKYGRSGTRRGRGRAR
jgi:4-alpha-glucanotransferase